MRVKYIATLKEISNETGFSVPTVSRVLRGKGEIGQKTREKILATAERLGYRSNLLVSGMRTGITKTIGVIIPIDEGFFSDIIRGIHDSLIEKDYVPILVWSRDERGQIARLIEHRVEGMIINPIEDEAGKDYFKEIYDREIPVVTVDRNLPHVDFSFSASDDYLGASMATEHLISLGHKKIAHLKGPQYASPAQMRRKGFEDTIAKHPDVSGRVSEEDACTFNLAAAASFLKRNPDITAVLAFNDLAAAAVCDAAAGLDLKVPDDLSVIGYGNLPLGLWKRPQMSTINQFPYMIGQNAVELLFDQIIRKEEGSTARTILTKPELIVRQSTAGG
ncbi:MAG: LacI family DNA-binding transcriptional regulator [Victivallales bacterium]